MPNWELIVVDVTQNKYHLPYFSLKDKDIASITAFKDLNQFICSNNQI